ncbi:MAG: energy transducer TonB [Dokdonella sp.]|nr:energy transducer TonB [Dokdonella sp.]MCB1574422.1 energy transducer TonB [Xanthomonadales bacterium]MCB1577789.1 energy transducer TonB [Xanthomonadales bacterium]
MISLHQTRRLGALLLLCFALASCNDPVPGSTPTATPESGNVTSDNSTKSAPSELPAPLVDRAPSEKLANRRLRPPKYPVQAVRDRAEGKVVLKVLVGADGKPEEITLEKSSGSEDLDRASITAVKTWDFNPGLKKGVAVPAYLIVPIEFNLNQ